MNPELLWGRVNAMRVKHSFARTGLFRYLIGRILLLCLLSAFIYIITVVIDIRFCFANTTSTQSAEEDDYDRWKDELVTDDGYIIWLLSIASELSEDYFGMKPCTMEEFTKYGLTPLVPDPLFRKDIHHIERLLHEYHQYDYMLYENSFATGSYDFLPPIDELKDRIKINKIESASPEHILAYRWQLLARMPKSLGAIESNGEYAVLFGYGSFPNFFSYWKKTVYFDCKIVKEFFINPYTGKKAKQYLWTNDWVDDTVQRGDLLILPATEWWREVAGNSSINIDLYHKYTVTIVGADPAYNMDMSS